MADAQDAEQRDGVGRGTVRHLQNTVSDEWGKPGKTREEHVDKKHTLAVKAAAKRAPKLLHAVLGLTHRLPTESLEEYELRKEREIRQIEASARARKAREREQATALALATPTGRIAPGATFKLWKGSSREGRWERLVVAAVGEQQSSRPGYGSVPLYTLTTADGSGKQYDRYDFSAFRGAQEAYRVRDVRPPPRTPTEARAASHQTRATARLGRELSHQTPAEARMTTRAIMRLGGQELPEV